MIYNTNQQVTQYLVEFSLKGDTKTVLDNMENLTEKTDEDLNMEDESRFPFISLKYFCSIDTEFHFLYITG